MGAGVTRRRKSREALELASFLRRMARALVRRAGEGDLDALTALVQSRDALDTAIGDAARALHYDFRDPYSWGDIARELGITRQAAQQRFGKGDRV
jgi:hypothetical protein